jgi:hypothetical protein
MEEIQVAVAHRRHWWYRSKRRDAGRIHPIRNGEKGARGARCAVRWIVRVVRVRSGVLHVRTSVRTELRLEHGTGGEEQLRRQE